MAKKKKIIKKTPTRVHSFRCTDKDWKELKRLAKVCGISIGKYLVETGLKHHPRQRLTPEESKALNSLTEARTDLIKIRSILRKASPEEKPKYIRSNKFMKWWLEAVEALIKHWYSIEENITSPVLTKVQEDK
ncbi:MAG: plasmid mobilization protein [Bacteroidaceae bacterium]